MSEILPCPFCGGPGVPFCPDPEYYPECWDIGCETDGCFMSEGADYRLAKEEVISWWNRRPSSGEQRPVAYGIAYMGELMPDTVNLSKDRVSDDIADRNQKYHEDAAKRKLVPLFTHPSPSEEAIREAAHAIQKHMYQADGVDFEEETEEFSPSKDREEIASIIRKHLGAK